MTFNHYPHPLGAIFPSFFFSTSGWERSWAADHMEHRKALFCWIQRLV